jgi:hypothetical protein
VKDGCFYYCDGQFRQSLNVAFNEAIGDEKQDCSFMARCDFDGIKVRPGDKVTGYSAERAGDCSTVEEKIICGQTGKFKVEGSNTEMADNTYKYSYCMPWDSTSEDIIKAYQP